MAQAGAKFLPPFCAVTAPGRSTDEGQAISCAWRIKPKLKTKIKKAEQHQALKQDVFEKLLDDPQVQQKIVALLSRRFGQIRGK